MNVYEYVVVYRVKENPRSAAAEGELQFIEGMVTGLFSGEYTAVNAVIADSPETLKKQVIRGVTLPDGVAIEDVEVLVRPFIATVSGWPGSPLSGLRLGANP